MERWAGKVAVVTGASAGIGLETARAFVRHGMVVVGLARRVDKMQERMKEVSGPGKFYAKACDIADENDVIRVFDWIEKNLKTVHILVNNAGCHTVGLIYGMKTEDMLRTINVNLIGLLHCTRKAVNIMKKHNHDAHIVNINSTAGHEIPGAPDVNVYPATKFGVTALSQTLINEIKGDKIRVTSISPGIVKTEFFDAAGFDSNFFDDKPSLDPKQVANSIIHVVSAPQNVQITELTIKPMGQL